MNIDDKGSEVLKKTKEYVKYWTHTLNERGNVEIRCILEDREVFIELSSKDIRHFNQWLEVAAMFGGRIKTVSKPCPKCGENNCFNVESSIEELDAKWFKCTFCLAISNKDDWLNAGGDTNANLERKEG